MAFNYFRVTKYNSSFVQQATQTYSDAADTLGASPANSPSKLVRCAVDDSGNIRLVAIGAAYYTALYASTGISFPSVRIYSCVLATNDLNKIFIIANGYEVSQPFRLPDNNRFYVAVKTNGNYQAGSKAADSCTLVDITNNAAAGHQSNGLGGTYQSGRPCAILGDYSVSSSLYDNDQSGTDWNYFAGSCLARPGYRAGVVNIPYAKISQQQTRTFELASLKIWDPKTTHVSGNMVSGSAMCKYDGYSCQNTGFAQVPYVTVATTTAAGSIASGTYSYVVLYYFKDKKGDITYGRCSSPVSWTSPGSKGASVQFTVPTITSFSGNDVVAAIYRTSSGGTQYNLVDTVLVYGTTSAGMAAGAVFEYVDNLTDANLASRPALYRQPGTAGTPLDRYPALASSHVVTHKDRVFYCNGSIVYYSGFAVDGEAPWFNPAFSIPIPGQGDITGLASMDGTLVVFKKNGVWLIDGDGPPDNGGNGTEFSSPRKIHTEHGCIDARTIVPIPAGVMYRSGLGIMLLDRGFQVHWAGERIQRTVDNYPLSGGATFDRNNGRVLFPVGNAYDGTYVSILDRGSYTGNKNLTLVYDIYNDAWSTFEYYYGQQDVAFAHGANTSGVQLDTVFSCGGSSSSSVVSYDDPANGYDNIDNTFPILKLQTGWVKASSAQDRNLFEDIGLLGFKGTRDFGLSCSYYWNYDTTSLISIATFASSTGVNPIQYQWQPTKPEAQACSFVFTVTANADTTNQKRMAFHAITVKFGTKGGGFKLPAAQRG